jgi:hypothetical protein
MALQTVAKLVPTAKDLGVKLSVHNPSSRYEIFQQMNCSWQWDWCCSRTDIRLQERSCLRNFPENIILPPGRSYHTALARLIFSRVKPGRATFRFGLIRLRSDFTSEEIERLYRSSQQQGHLLNNGGAIPSHSKPQREIIWGNSVSVLIRKDWPVQW